VVPYTGVGYKDQAMEIDNTTFGSITVGGKTYEHDVLIRLSGEVVKRKKKLSLPTSAGQVACPLLGGEAGGRSLGFL